MCGRFFVAPDDPELMEILKRLEEENRRARLALPPVKPGEMFPTNHAAVIAAIRREPAPMQMQWGFKAYDGKLLINARSETVQEKPTFKKPVRENRCLIPASYYYEWKKSPDLKRKIRHIMRDPKHTSVYMAGIFRLEAPDDVPRFVILTRRAAKQIADIHDRMPVMLEGDARDAWLAPDAPVDDILDSAIERIEGLPEDDDNVEQEGFL